MGGAIYPLPGRCLDPKSIIWWRVGYLWYAHGDGDGDGHPISGQRRLVGKRPLFLWECKLPSTFPFTDNGWGKSGSAYGGYAGALRVDHALASIEGNVFSHNRATNDYGAVYVPTSDLALKGNLITGNRSYRTSGLFLVSAQPMTVTNNIIVDNRSTDTALPQPVISVYYSNGSFPHNTIARNRNFSGSNAGAAYGILVDKATLALTNTILVSHTVGISVTAGSTVTMEGTLWGSGCWANGSDWGRAGTIVTGTVNLWVDPAFVNPNAGDYHLGPASAATDAGGDAGVTTDIDGETRPFGSGYDIGADEFAYRLYLPLVLRSFP